MGKKDPSVALVSGLRYYATTSAFQPSFLDFDGHRFEWLVAEVLFRLGRWRLPDNVAGLVFYGLDLARRVLNSKLLIGEEDGYHDRWNTRAWEPLRGA